MPLSIQDKTLPSGEVGKPYDFRLSAKGGESPYTWTAAPLPSPLKCRTDGTITGMPNSPFVGTVLVQVTDRSQQTASAYFNLFIRKSPLSVETTALANGTVGTFYTAALRAEGGATSYTWSISGGNLPPGLSCSASGTLSGTPQASGSSSFTVQVTDAAGTKARATLSIAVNIGALKVTTTALPNGAVGISYAGNLTAQGGIGSYAWTIPSGLPAGLSCNASGIISGTPQASGSSSLTVQVTDGAGTKVRATLSIAVIATALTITTTALPNGTAGVPYSGTLSARGGTMPYRWKIPAGVLPLGLDGNPSGLVTGIPLAFAASLFTVTATDRMDATATAPVKIDVNAGSGGWTTLYQNQATFGTALLGFFNGIFVLASSSPSGPLATWTSSNGTAWLPTSGPGINVSLAYPVMVNGGGQLWLLGIGNRDLKYYVFTFDLQTSSWNQVSARPWPGLALNCSVVWFNGALWAMGGQTNAGVTNNIWTSPDGVSWVQRPNASWPPRMFAGACVFDGKLWTGGGVTSYRSPAFNDLWSTADGITWTQAPAVPWTAATNSAPAWLAGTESTLYAMTCAGPNGDWASLMLWEMTSGGTWSPGNAAGGLQTYNFLPIGLVTIGKTLLAAVGTGHGDCLQMAMFCPKD